MFTANPHILSAAIMVNTSSTEILMNIVIWADDIIQQMVLQTTLTLTVV